MLLKAATKYHTNEAGLLFQTDNHIITACQRAFDKYGKDKAMQVIDNVYIDFSQDGPQLLQVSLFLFLIPAIDYVLSNLGSSPLQSTSNTQKAS